MSAPRASGRWNSTRMLRPIADEYTSRYSTGRPSRENALRIRGVHRGGQPAERQRRGKREENAAHLVV